MKKQAKIDFIINLVYFILVILLAIVSVNILLKYLFPFVIAAIVAFLMQKPANKIAPKLRVKKGIIAAFLSAFFYLLIVLFLGFFVYKVIQHLITFSNYFLDNVVNLDALSDFLNKFKVISEDMIKNVILRFADYISSLAGKFAKSLPSFFVSSIVALVATCYIAKDFERLCAFLKEFCGSKMYGKILKIKNIAFESVFKIAKGYLILCFITYVQIVIGLWLLKVKYFVFIAAVISIIDLLPVLGTGTVFLPWGIYEIFFGSVSRGIGIGVLYLVVLLVRNFLEPKVISRQIGVYPLFTLLSMFIGLKLIGFAGIIVFPVFLIVVVKYYKSEIVESDRLSQ